MRYTAATDPFPSMLLCLKKMLYHIQIADLENEKQELIKQLDEQKAKCDNIEKKESERRQVEEKKHSEEILVLKRTNQQLKVPIWERMWL